jgi:thiosulfate reductase cytochrome b subunit
MEPQAGNSHVGLTISDEQATSTKAKVIQPAWVRAVHWTNAFAMVLMIMSGWQIYNASPLFDFRFSSSITLGGWLGGALLWHFAAMWLLMVNGLIYLTVGLATGRFRKKLLPITPEGVISDTKAALTGSCRTRISPSTTRCRSCFTRASSLSASSLCCRAWRSGSRCSCNI